MEERLMECLCIAMKYHVTDIHFTVHENNELAVEMRVNGVMRKLTDKQYDIRFFRYLLYRANLDVSNLTKPQTGRFEIVLNEKKYALRFALMSSLYIKSAVLRILNNHPYLMIENLTTNQRQVEWMYSILQRRSGLFLFSGPTGSGKTTTLYTLLNTVKGKKIYSLEDPVELYSDKYVQLQINEKQNLGYAEGIKQLLRHDPDIIMIGEIRDQEAANMAVRCALTGHLVLSTIHASTCVNAIHRMEELGVDSLQLKDILYGVSSQRLYDTNTNEKIGVYECMDRKEVEYYFRNRCVTEEHKNLSEEITSAIERNKNICIQQVEQDIESN